jgi:hypothetical protein
MNSDNCSVINLGVVDLYLCQASEIYKIAKNTFMKHTYTPAEMSPVDCRRTSGSCLSFQK